MAKPTGVNPTAKKIIGEMFGGEGKETREAARAEAGESAASAAAEETAERVGSILDEVAIGPEAEKPTEEKPATEEKIEVKPDAEKPAAAAKPAETPAGEKPAETAKPEDAATVPTWALVAERQEKAKAIEENARLKAELEAAKAKPAEVKKPPEDPEPDKIKHPIEHDEWETRELKRENAAIREELKTVTKTVTELGQSREIEEKTKEFDRLVAIHRDVYAGESPEFNEKREFLRGALIKEIAALGLPPQFKGKTPEFAVDEMEREMVGITLANTSDPRAPFKRIEALADARGYEWYKQSKTAKPNGTNGNSKPAPKTDQERIAAGERLASAARTTTTMPGTSPKAPVDTDAMTAEKFAALTPAQRRAYKKQHPDALEKLMGGEGEESTIF